MRLKMEKHAWGNYDMHAYVMHYRNFSKLIVFRYAQSEL